MAKVGIPLEDIRSGQFNGPRVSVTTCVDARRRPTVHDRNHPLLTQWSVTGSPGFSNDGEVWQLVRFNNSGEAIWKRVSYSSAGPSISTIEIDDFTEVSADGIGMVRLFSDPVGFKSEPVKFVGDDENTIGLEIQIAGTTEEEPHTFEHVGLCSFDQKYFKISSFGDVTLKKGSKPSIQIISVDSNERPGVTDIEPTEDGGVFFGANIVDPHDIPIETKSYRDGSFELELQLASVSDGEDTAKVGAASFHKDHFEINEMGNVRLANAGLSVNRIVVDAKQGDGYESVKPHKTGSINLSAKAVANCYTPIRTVSRDGHMIAVEAQYAGITTEKSPPHSGLSHYDVSQFSSDDGFVQLRVPAGGTAGTTINIAFCDYQGRITVHGETASLSYKNPGYVVLPSNKSPGMLITHKLTEDLHIDISDMDQCTFGTTPGVAWEYMMPVYLGFIADCNDKNVVPILARIPCVKHFLGAEHYSVFTSNSAVYEYSVIETVGSFRMKKSSQDIWSVEEFDHRDGVGRWNDEHGFFMPLGQNGADKNSPFFLNKGSYAPVFDGTDLKYTLHRNGFINFSIYLSRCKTSGVGLSRAVLASPFNINIEMSGLIKNGRKKSMEKVTSSGEYGHYIDLFFDDLSPVLLCDFEQSNDLALKMSGHGWVYD